uniref:Beta-1,4 N-acetylgalactosaminyltransferase 1-like n=2 Tax=Gouania willdenowi TaxID=441366 RepID=A0A8C5DRZ5_GOUWI
MPMTPTHIPDLRLFPERRSNYKVNLKVSKGILTINSPTKQSSVTESNNQTELTIVSTSPVTVNFLLANMLYTSSSYHINTGDFVSFRFEKHEAVFPVTIKQPHVPVLWDIGTDINSRVTITTMTSPPFSNTKALVESIRYYYPTIKIFIADDINKRRTFSGPNVEQYFMPQAKGLFAGRNLVLSQLTTKYFLWVDDTFMFTETTKIEKFVEVMEANPELDVVGGSLEEIPFYMSMFYEEGDDDEGGCLHMKFGAKFHSLPAYPHCSLVSGVVNFFLARTDAVRRVGFDPNIRKTGHPELFMDGLGSLMVASCNDPQNMSINLQPQLDQDYLNRKYRNPEYDEYDYRYPIYFLKNHLKCLTAA